MGTPPIEEMNFIFGVNVVQIEDMRIARGLSRRPFSACPHVRLFYDQKERRVWCSDCESDIEAFDAFLILVERAHAHAAHLTQREKAVHESETHHAIFLAVKTLDAVWRTKKRVPKCPHCREALLPEDIKGGVDVASAELVRAARKKNEAKP